MEVADVERPEGLEGFRVGDSDVVCRAVEVGEIKTEPPDPPICKVAEFFGGGPEHRAAAKDRRQVLKSEAGVGVAVEEPVELFSCGKAAAGFVPPGVDDDRIRAEEICGLEGPVHGLLDVFLRERPGVVGSRGAGVHPVAVVGCGDAGRGEASSRV